MHEKDFALYSVAAITGLLIYYLSPKQEPAPQTIEEKIFEKLPDNEPAFPEKTSEEIPTIRPARVLL